VPWEITCKDCNKAFLFDDLEQERYSRDGFAPPKRCKPCRAVRRGARIASTESEDTPLPVDPPAPPPAPPPSTPPRAQFEAQCGACGVLTSVPFEPTEKRPVYCDTCFQYR
jgi:CxxC-x17-CxxC domain-containing protein